MAPSAPVRRWPAGPRASWLLDQPDHESWRAARWRAGPRAGGQPAGQLPCAPRQRGEGAEAGDGDEGAVGGSGHRVRPRRGGAPCRVRVAGTDGLIGRPWTRRCRRGGARWRPGGARPGTNAGRPSTGRHRAPAGAAGRPRSSVSPRSSPRRFDLSRRLGVHDPGLGVGQQALGQADLLRARAPGGAEVREPVQHGHVGHAVGAGELPGRLQPPGDTEVGRIAQASSTTTRCAADRPALGTAACSHAVAQVMRMPERGGAVHGGQVEHDERRVEVAARRRRAVEHPAQVAVDQAAQLEGDVSAVGRQAWRCRSGWRAPPRASGRAGRRPPAAASSGRSLARWGSRLHRQVHGRPLAGLQAAGRGTRCRATPRSSERRRPAWLGCPVVTRGGVEGIEPDRPPGRRHTGSTPHARARSVYSPLGSTTQAWRPNSDCRQR